MNARCPCTPPLTVETFGEKISAEASSGKEIAGLLKIKNMMTLKIVKSRVSRFLRGQLEASLASQTVRGKDGLVPWTAPECWCGQSDCSICQLAH